LEFLSKFSLSGLDQIRSRVGLQIRSFVYRKLSRISSPPCDRWVSFLQLFCCFKAKLQIWPWRVFSERMETSVDCSRSRKRSTRIPQTSIYPTRTLFSWLRCSSDSCERCLIPSSHSGYISFSVLLPVS